MEIIYKPFSELSSSELEDVLRLRQNVFIIEQNCFYEDIDGFDEKANHLLFYEGNKLAAYLRLFPKGSKLDDEISLGRIVVDPEFRGIGLGPVLIKKGIQLSEGEPIRIEAQAALTKYYNELGFTEEGEVYVVDGIDHIQMTLT
ncbi:MAG: GNAT family N-acetyltransferase [Balneola sp.]|jgi:ElaA protein|nr:GNAT family N-acetyltransferase [Balneola sp.]MBE80702.1 GNAT family N-acetyltransferase [Balneola sp.]|tara:strand:+ start:2345 stop:2776 length:432 start_codon:yes stop_codon:yes gene_type:complete